MSLMHIWGSCLPLRVHLQTGFKGARLSQQQVDWNTRMSEVRVSAQEC